MPHATPMPLENATGMRCRLVQILNNLLANAAKFTHEGEVRVSADRLANMWAVRVADTGIGIPAERFDAIFNAFEQARARLAFCTLHRRTCLVHLLESPRGRFPAPWLPCQSTHVRAFPWAAVSSCLRSSHSPA